MSGKKSGDLRTLHARISKEKAERYKIYCMLHEVSISADLAEYINNRITKNKELIDKYLNIKVK